MERGDIELLQYLLSAHGLDLENVVDVDRRLRESTGTVSIITESTKSYVSDECFRFLITHPKIDVNHVSHNGFTPLLGIAMSFIGKRKPVEDEQIQLLRLLMLIEEGADPHPQVFDGQSCIEYLRKQLKTSRGYSAGRGKALLQELERPVS